MREANEMDGAVGNTQDPIRSGQSFTYKFTISPDEHGTFWWHADDGTQRADGLYGGFVVHEPQSEGSPDDLAEERLLMIGDWYHRTGSEVLEHYMQPEASGLINLPDSVLVNGAGAYTCSDAVPALPVDCIQIEQTRLPTMRLQPKRRTVFRVVNAGAYAGISMTVPGSVLTPLSVDAGHKISANASKSVGVLYPGERVEMLIELDPVVAHYNSELVVALDDTPSRFDNQAVTISHQLPLQWNGRHYKRSRQSGISPNHFDLQTAKSVEDQTAVLPTLAQHTIVLYASTEKLARLADEPRGFINNTSFRPQKPAINAVSRSRWDENQFVPHIPYNQDSPTWVDIVVNNLDEESHPFHLHGYNFWVLSSYTSEFNWGSYNPYEDDRPPAGDYKLKDALKKDTLYVPRHGHAVLRLLADNPGIWAFHSHVSWHEASGMSMAFDVRC